MGFRTNQMMTPIEGAGQPPPPMDYQQALLKLIEQRKAAQPRPGAMEANDQQSALGTLLNQLSKSQAMMGNIGGKPTDSSGIDFQDYGKAASERAKQNNLLANQNFEQGLQTQTAQMGVDKFAGDQAAAAYQLEQRPLLEQRAEEDRLLKNKLTESQISENKAKAGQLNSKVKQPSSFGFDAEDKDLATAMRIQNLKKFLAQPGAEQAKPAEFKAATDRVAKYEAEQSAVNNALQTKNLTPAQKAVDLSYAKTYTDWVQNGRGNIQRNIDTLKKVESDLTTKDVTGIAGRLPDFLRGRESLATQQDANSVSAESLKQILGGQFTEKDREFLVKNSYDPTQDESVNKARAEKTRKFLEGKVKVIDAQAREYEEKGTLSKYKPITDTPDKTVVKKQYNAARNQTKIIYSDGTEEVKDGQ